MTGATPRWRRLVATAEKELAPRVDALVRSEGFADAFGLLSRTQGSLRRRYRRSTRRLLHALNLPAGTDVTRLLNEIGRLQEEVADLRRELTDPEED